MAYLLLPFGKFLPLFLMIKTEPKTVPAIQMNMFCIQILEGTPYDTMARVPIKIAGNIRK